MNTFDFLALAWFVGWNVVTCFVFGWDKWRARNSSNRVSETTLVMLAALGGWVGGLFGMKLFRHKTGKGTFQLKYALALIPFAAQLWFWWRYR